MHWSWVAIFAVLAIATAWDLFTGRIPNWLVLPFLAAGLAMGGIQHGWAGAGASLAGIGVAVLFAGPFCWLRGMGLGDLKLCAGIGAWIGPAELCFALVMTALAGGVLALGYALFRGSLGASLDRTGNLLAGMCKGRLPEERKRPFGSSGPAGIPYAPAIAIGTLFAFFAYGG